MTCRVVGVPIVVRNRYVEVYMGTEVLIREVNGACVLREDAVHFNLRDVPRHELYSVLCAKCSTYVRTRFENLRRTVFLVTCHYILRHVLSIVTHVSPVNYVKARNIDAGSAKAYVLRLTPPIVAMILYTDSRHELWVSYRARTVKDILKYLGE